MKSNNPIVADALAYNGKPIAESNVRSYRQEVKAKLTRLNTDVRSLYESLVSNGNALRASAKAETKTGVESQIQTIMNEFLPDLRKVSNMIDGLARDAAAL